MRNQKRHSRAPMMLAMAVALALPFALTAGIGIYRAGSEPAKRAAADPQPPATPSTDAGEADGER